MTSLVSARPGSLTPFQRNILPKPLLCLATDLELQQVLLLVWVLFRIQRKVIVRKIWKVNSLSKSLSIILILYSYILFMMMGTSGGLGSLGSSCCRMLTFWAWNKTSMAMDTVTLMYKCACMHVQCKWLMCKKALQFLEMPGRQDTTAIFPAGLAFTPLLPTLTILQQGVASAAYMQDHHLSACYQVAP